MIDQNKVILQTPMVRVIALSETEVGKILYSNSRRELEWEAERLQYANSINDLLVVFKRIDTLGSQHMLVMERLYPIEVRAFEPEVCRGFFAVFQDKLSQLHESGFVFGDFDRTRLSPGNVVLTMLGIRLLDAANSALRDDVGEAHFERVRLSDLDGLQAVSRRFLRSSDERVELPPFVDNEFVD